MGIFDVFRRKPATPQPAIEAKESATGAAMVMNPGQATWTPRDYKAFAHEGYQKNVVAYQAINKIGEAVASVPPLLFRGDDEITEHAVLTLLGKPNPMQDFASYVQALIGFYMLSGNSYQERVVVGAEPRELYVLRSDRMKIIPSNTGMPAAYVYDVNGRKVRWDVDPNTMESDVLHTKTFNPLDDWYGMSPVEAAAYAIDQHNEAMAWMQALLQNSARPSGALVAGGDTALSDDQFQALKRELEDAYQGAQNAGRPMLLEGGLDWKQMGLSPSDMGIIEQKSTSARDICLAFGVPPQLLGIPGDNTYSNYQEARLAFWEDTVLPLMSSVYGAWNNWLLPAYGDGLELRPDLDQVPAIVEKRQRLWDMADNSQDLTINERRELKGYDTIEGGDVIMAPANMMPVDSAPDLLSDLDAKALAYGLSENVVPIDKKA